MRSPSPRHLLAAALVLTTIVGGCLSPTLPLPPPEAPRAIQQGANGTWTVAGDCVPGALVTVFVERTGIGTVVEDRDADGFYAAEVEGARCDVVRIWQDDGDESSASLQVVLQAVENGAPLDDSECVR